MKGKKNNGPRVITKQSSEEPSTNATTRRQTEYEHGSQQIVCIYVCCNRFEHPDRQPKRADKNLYKCINNRQRQDNYGLIWIERHTLTHTCMQTAQKLIVRWSIVDIVRNTKRPHGQTQQQTEPFFYAIKSFWSVPNKAAFYFCRSIAVRIRTRLVIIYSPRTAPQPATQSKLNIVIIAAVVVCCPNMKFAVFSIVLLCVIICIECRPYQGRKHGWCPFFFFFLFTQDS